MNKRPRPEAPDPRKKLIYLEDRVFAAKNKNDEWYMASTTFDPDESFKTHFICKLKSAPEDKFIQREVVENNRTRFYLRREEIGKHVERYGYKIVNEKSPWRPMDIGEEDGDDVVAPDDTPDAKKPRITVEDNYQLLLEIVTILRHLTNSATTVPEDGSGDQASQ